MSFVDGLVEEFRDMERDRVSREAQRHGRLLLLQEHGPVFFDRLKERVRSGIKDIADRQPSLKAMVLDDSSRGHFAVRSPDLRPMVKVSAYLSTTSMLLGVEERENPASSEAKERSERIEFGIGDDNNLTLCLQCQPVDIDDVARLILRYAMGL